MFQRDLDEVSPTQELRESVRETGQRREWGMSEHNSVKSSREYYPQRITCDKSKYRDRACVKNRYETYEVVCQPKNSLMRNIRAVLLITVFVYSR